MAVTTYGKSVRVIEIPWTSDGSGDASEVFSMDGEAYRTVHVPGAATPTTNYMVVFTDSDGALLWVDQTISSGSATAFPALGTERVFYGTVTATVSAAGSAKNGTIKVYVR